MKKMLLATALALLITGCAQQTFTVQNKPAGNKETITHHFCIVSGIGRENCRCSPKFVAAQKMLLGRKNRNPANIRK